MDSLIVVGVLSGTSVDSISVGVFKIEDKNKNLKTEKNKEEKEFDSCYNYDYDIKKICFEQIDWDPKIQKQIFNLIEGF
jgi:hypothetical protein